MHHPIKERRTHVNQEQALNTTVIGYGCFNCSAPRRGIDFAAFVNSPSQEHQSAPRSDTATTHYNNVRVPQFGHSLFAQEAIIPRELSFEISDLGPETNRDMS